MRSSQLNLEDGTATIFTRAYPLPLFCFRDEPKIFEHNLKRLHSAARTQSPVLLPKLAGLLEHKAALLMVVSTLLTEMVSAQHSGGFDKKRLQGEMCQPARVPVPPVGGTVAHVSEFEFLAQKPCRRRRARQTRRHRRRTCRPQFYEASSGVEEAMMFNRYREPTYIRAKLRVCSMRPSTHRQGTYHGRVRYNARRSLVIVFRDPPRLTRWSTLSNTFLQPIEV